MVFENYHILLKVLHHPFGCSYKLASIAVYESVRSQLHVATYRLTVDPHTEQHDRHQIIWRQIIRGFSLCLLCLSIWKQTKQHIVQKRLLRRTAVSHCTRTSSQQTSSEKYQMGIAGSKATVVGSQSILANHTAEGVLLVDGLLKIDQSSTRHCRLMASSRVVAGRYRQREELHTFPPQLEGVPINPDGNSLRLVAVPEAPTDIWHI